MTMRQIDADAIITVQMFDDEYEEYITKTMTVGEFIDSFTEEGCPPTVEPKQKWISVKDRLPEDNRFVLVCNDDGHMMVAQYIGEGHIWEWQYKYTNYDVDVWDDQEQGPVCWWMPLPEPPKMEGGENDG